MIQLLADAVLIEFHYVFHGPKCDVTIHGYELDIAPLVLMLVLVAALS